MTHILQRACIRPLILVLSLTFIKLSEATAQPAATAARYPSTASSVSHANSVFAFTNPQRACASDNNYSSAAASLFVPSGTTEYLITSGHGFALPLTATITGIEVRVERRATGNTSILGVPVSYVTDHTVRLVRNGVLVGDNKATSSHWSSSEITITYGGVNDDWGLTWYPADINAGNFGVAFSAELNGLLTWYPAVQVDGITITVHYLEPVLPLKLLRFTTTLKPDNTVLAAWQSTGDQDATYILERSQDGVTWEAVPGQVQHTTLAGIENYEQTDPHPFPGIAYYRLAMRDASGVQSWSAVRTVRVGLAKRIHVYPNPATDYVVISGIYQGDQPVLTDANGRNVPVSVVRQSTDMIKLDIRTLKSGIYFLKTGNEVQRIMKTGY